MTSLPGGWIADRTARPAPGGAVRRHPDRVRPLQLAVPSLTTFYLGLVLIVIGTGLLKPNISVIVGQLYAPDDHRRDAGLLHLLHGHQPRRVLLAPGLRIPRTAGELARGIRGCRCRHDAWLGSVRPGGRYLGDAGLHPAPASPAEAAILWQRAKLWVGVATLLSRRLAGAVCGRAADHAAADCRRGRLSAPHDDRRVLRLAVPWRGLDARERKRLYAIGVFFLAAALFWSEFEQAGSTLNLFADRATRTPSSGWSFPSSWFQSVNALFIIAFAPVFAWMWVQLGSREPSSPVKFSVGLIGVGAGFAISCRRRKRARPGRS